MLIRLVRFVVILSLGLTSLPAAGPAMADGGTVSINAQRVRLHGIDMPSVDAICTTSQGRQWPCGRRVREQLAEAAALGPIVCQPAERQTVICRAGGMDVAALLVKEGLARAAGDYQDLEDGARTAKIGLWE